MKIFNVMLFGLLMFFFSCKKDLPTPTAKLTLSHDSKFPTDNIDSVSVDNYVLSKKDIRHFSLANGGSILYLNNGDVKGQARFDTDGDFLDELLKTETYGKFEEFDSYVIQKKSGQRDNFFNEFGEIIGSWKILKGIPINNLMTVISYSSPKKPTNGNTETISDTRLIILSPEIKKFKDENSEEADNYFTALDDHNWYSSELSETFKKLGVETTYPKKNNLKFKIDNDPDLILDTKRKINNYAVSALLYKKEKRPLIIYLIPSDNDLPAIQDYLR